MGKWSPADSGPKELVGGDWVSKPDWWVAEWQKWVTAPEGWIGEGLAEDGRARMVRGWWREESEAVEWSEGLA